MIYIDTSVVVAYLFQESDRPSDEIWDEFLFSSQILEVELWCTIDRLDRREADAVSAQNLIDRIYLVDLTPEIHRRACSPMGFALRGMDAIHMATLLDAKDEDENVSLATYDKEMKAAAPVLGIRLDPRLP